MTEMMLDESSNEASNMMRNEYFYSEESSNLASVDTTVNKM